MPHAPKAQHPARLAPSPPAIAFANDADEAGSASVDLLKADADDTFALGLFPGKALTMIDPYTIVTPRARQSE